MIASFLQLSKVQQASWFRVLLKKSQNATKRSILQKQPCLVRPVEIIRRAQPKKLPYQNGALKRRRRRSPLSYTFSLLLIFFNQFFYF